MDPRSQRIAAGLTTLVGLLVIAFTFEDYGITWDEPIQSAYGEGVVRYFASGLEDRSIDDLHHMRFYGPLFEALVAASYAGNPDEKYAVRHLWIAWSGLATVLGVLALAFWLRSRWLPLFAPLLLVALPRFYGHAFNNSKDVPFAAGFVWSAVALARFCEQPSRWGRVCALGLALGITLGIRPGGLPLLALLFGAVLGWAWWAGQLSTRDGLLRGAAAWGLAWMVWVAFWPWAHLDPIGNPLRAIAAALSFPDTFPVLFEGAVTQSDELPRHYLAKYLVITTPPIALILAAAGLGTLARSCASAPRGREAPVWAGLAVWLLAPLALATVSRPNVYDGMRHLLFALPALALIAGLGASRLVEAISKPAFRPVAAAVLFVLCALPFWSHVRLHPYQSTYFNAFVGGVEGASGRYETDYWLSSYKEAVEWVNAQAEREGEVTVLVAADRYSLECASRFVRPGVRVGHIVGRELLGDLPEPFDYYVATTRYGLDDNFPEAPIVHRVGRSGATFTVIRRRAVDALAAR